MKLLGDKKEDWIELFVSARDGSLGITVNEDSNGDNRCDESTIYLTRAEAKELGLALLNFSFSGCIE